jgi:hypothetical protein
MNSTQNRAVRYFHGGAGREDSSRRAPHARSRSAPGAAAPRRLRLCICQSRGLLRRAARDACRGGCAGLSGVPARASSADSTRLPRALTAPSRNAKHPLQLVSGFLSPDEHVRTLHGALCARRPHVRRPASQISGAELWEVAASRHANRPLLGTRTVGADGSPGGCARYAAASSLRVRG